MIGEAIFWLIVAAGAIFAACRFYDVLASIAFSLDTIAKALMHTAESTLDVSASIKRIEKDLLDDEKEESFK